jgi:hypothetical protein
MPALDEFLQDGAAGAARGGQKDDVHGKAP